MTEEVQNKIAKVYELVNRGEQGEREAAKKALDKLLKKYNLDESAIAAIKLRRYTFKYSTNLELMLLSQLIEYFLKGKEVAAYRDTRMCREVVMKLEYVDFILIDTAYEYFRRHMKAQYKKLCLPKINRCRSVKTKNKRRAELQDLFFRKYVVASKIYHTDQLETVDLSTLTDKERKDRMALSGVQGGEYNSQVSTGLYLEA
ncbi:hypothetical protein FUA48_16190 [Flavobacterium alkalisoli]|uniref:DUF2786 domain-containing protein n=1 Tax=Flavobacterium alkalisoli TaxID=2602769 RepID=A0A5B9FVL3_9FLAO|nr:hypothetical protein [Flavobacterium alkalisoli]QEE51060.1 hypothetical protein FUA48_16190 [Flavobacterium alkalisoli]